MFKLVWELVKVKAHATVRIGFCSENMLKVVLEALMPETEKTATSRSIVTVQRKDASLMLKVEAKDTVALRAALNSYLHWIALAADAYLAAASANQ